MTIKSKNWDGERACGLKSVTPVLVSLFLGCLTGGCSDLTFDRQRLAFAQNSRDDNAHLFLSYEGLQAGSNDLAKANSTLDRCFKKRQQFFIGDPLCAFVLESNKEELSREDGFQKALVQHVSIDAADLFLNTDGRLCGRQSLCIHEPAEFVDKLNAILSDQIAEGVMNELQAGDQPNDVLDRQSLLLIQAAAKRRHPWLRLDKGRISFMLPGTAGCFTQLKRQLLFDQGNWTSPQERLESVGRVHTFLAETPLSIDQRRDRMVIAIGTGDGEPFVIKFNSGRDIPLQTDNKLIVHAQALVGKLKKEKTERPIEDFLLRHRGMPHD